MARKPRAEDSPLKGLKKSRHDKGWSLEDLEEKTGVSAPYLSRLERGKAVPTRETLTTITKELGADPRLLMERDRLELERLGFEPRVAGIVARLEADGRFDVLGRLLRFLDASDDPAREAFYDALDRLASPRARTSPQSR